jgi:hypothetical protein
MADIKYKNVIEYLDDSSNTYSHGIEYSDSSACFCFIVNDNGTEYIYPTELTLEDENEHFVEYSYDIPNQLLKLRLDNGEWVEQSIPLLPQNVVYANLEYYIEPIISPSDLNYLFLTFDSTSESDSKIFWYRGDTTQLDYSHDYCIDSTGVEWTRNSEFEMDYTTYIVGNGSNKAITDLVDGTAYTDYIQLPSDTTSFSFGMWVNKGQNPVLDPEWTLAWNAFWFSVEDEESGAEIGFGFENDVFSSKLPYTTMEDDTWYFIWLGVDGRNIWSGVNDKVVSSIHTGGPSPLETEIVLRNIRFTMESWIPRSGEITVITPGYFFINNIMFYDKCINLYNLAMLEEHPESVKMISLNNDEDHNPHSFVEIDEMLFGNYGDLLSVLYGEDSAGNDCVKLHAFCQLEGDLFDNYYQSFVLYSEDTISSSESTFIVEFDISLDTTSSQEYCQWGIMIADSENPHIGYYLMYSDGVFYAAVVSAENWGITDPASLEVNEITHMKFVMNKGGNAEVFVNDVALTWQTPIACPEETTTFNGVYFGNSIYAEENIKNSVYIKNLHIYAE